MNLRACVPRLAGTKATDLMGFSISVLGHDMASRPALIAPPRHGKFPEGWKAHAALGMVSVQKTSIPCLCCGGIGGVAPGRPPQERLITKDLLKMTIYPPLVRIADYLPPGPTFPGCVHP